MRLTEVEIVESDGCHRNKIAICESTDKPLIKTFKPAKGSKFTESITYSFFKEVFLPQGFPHSVHKDYVPFQIWDTLQAFASTINGTLTTHSIMKGVGVGESTATPLAAAITWILKDGTGMIGRIMFAWWQGNNLGNQCKKWRLFADILNDVAISIEVIVPYISTLSSYTLCLTTGMRAIVGIAGGATRTSIMQHHAIKDNMADISAKEHSQGTLVNLAGSIVGILILLLVHEKLFIYICVLLVMVHVISNYFAVTSLQINTLNEDRLSLVIEDYVLYHSISSVEEINKRESVFIFLDQPARKIFGFEIEIGTSLEQILKLNLVNTKNLIFLKELFQRRKYLPIIDKKQKRIYVILSKEVEDIDIIKAYYHSCIYGLIASHIMKLKTETLVKKKFSGPSFPLMRIINFPRKFYLMFNENDKSVPAEFISAIDDVVYTDCNMFIELLNKSAWVLKSNMLPIKSWKSAW